MSKLDFDRVNDVALRNFVTVLRHFAPGGKIRGKEYVALNPTRDDRKAGSFSIDINTGVGRDFATGEGFNDPVAFVAYVNGTGMGEACKALASFLAIDCKISGNNTAPTSPAKKKAPPPEFLPVVPVPSEAVERCPSTVGRMGKPSMIWDYLSPNGDQILLRVLRFDRQQGEGRRKDYRPLCYGKDKSGKLGWHSKLPANNRPLYGLDKLAKHPSTATVLLCEGEKAADAAQPLFPDAVAMAWPSGSKAIGKADFTPLRGRTVWYWPDNDKAGADSIGPLRAVLGVAGVESFQPFDLSLFARFKPANTPAKGAELQEATPDYSWPEKADAADALALGWNSDHMPLLIAKGLTPDNAAKQGKADSAGGGESPGRYQSKDDGLYCFNAKYEKYQYVGGPLKVAAR